MPSITVSIDDHSTVRVGVTPESGIELEEAISLLASGMAWVLFRAGATSEEQVDMYLSAAQMGTKALVRAAEEDSAKDDLEQ